MKNKIALIIIALGVIIGLGIIFFGKNNDNSPKTNGEKITQKSVPNTEIKDGVQYVYIDAKGGYSPRTSTAQAGIPTKLIVRTNGTYDCSASLVVRSVGYQKILPKTGEEIIDLGTPTAGVPIRGVCGMGMYSFEIDFQ